MEVTVGDSLTKVVNEGVLKVKGTMECLANAQRLPGVLSIGTPAAHKEVKEGVRSGIEGEVN